MKGLRKAAILASALILLAAAGAQAQETPQNSDLLRQKIEDLEKIDLQSRSTTVQEIYKKTLLRLYQQYTSALQQDISDLRKIQSIADRNNSTPQSELATQIQRLVAERNLTEEKIKTLSADTETRSGGLSRLPPSTNTNRVKSDSRSGSEDGGVTATRNSLSVANKIAARVDAVPTEPTKIILCGQIRPASLTQIFSFIGSVPSNVLSRTQAIANSEAVKRSRLSVEDSTNNDSLDTNCMPKRNEKVEDLRKKAVTEKVIKLQPLSEDERIKVYDGSEKDAVVITLQTLLDELKTSDKGREALQELAGLSTETIRKQILLLQGYIGNVKVVIQDEDGDPVVTPLTDKDGNFEAMVGPNQKYSISTEADSGNTIRDVYIADKAVRVNIPIEDRPVSLLSRAIVGYEQSGAAAAKHDQNYFFDLFVSKSFPFRQKIDPDFGEKLRTWIDFRFASVPQTGDVTVGDFTTGFAAQVSSLKVKDVARVFEFLGGLEYRLSGNGGLLPSFDRQTKQKFSLSLIAGGGFTTPINPLELISIFKVTPGAPGLPPQAVGKDFVAFIQSDRDRFFRQYYVGLRMQTFFFNLFNMPMQRFPAQLDVAVGQNEFLTGGKLKGPVVRIDGFFPLPYDGLKFINIFGTALLRPGHSVTGIPLVLQPAPDGTVVPAQNVGLVALPQPSRDYYRVGFGIDLMSLVQKWAQKK